ncbi:uncharacterized protein K460DRAFT_370178 [Cucurbitaria berberidis CBS 394.84]|uniref:Ribonuclease H2 subunit B n=1 Tax=Cucurbitaria berberidis CBS 394.84 TaxID=1168544 RepID=A0A9P4GAH2_9PLEO|nr:uncharacterized protein K460DRAFT_370178 [Cucurbitaria berberidis CBS 394.84]KAF1842193.1 hypothetical protein K460DRAFT_370178 [Cucurbitaria berberidis CBS 394.84]
MARTRSKPAKATPKESTPEPTPSTIKPLPTSTSNPPKLFVLPRDASKDARIVTLDNPANDTPSRYYFCPEKGFHEFTRIAAPKKDCKSWLITGEKSGEHDDSKDAAESEDDVRIGSGYITKSADLFIATPIDILFLVLPALAPKSAKETKQHFLALDDYLDMFSTSARHWKALLIQYPSLKRMVEKRMRAVCDTVDAGDETMFRLSNEKLVHVLMKKAERMVKNGLPPSLEDKFIKTALEVPIMSIKREESTLSAVSITETVIDGTSTPSTNVESQSEASVTTSIESQTSVNTSITIPEDIPSKPSLHTPSEIPYLLRLRTSLNYLSSSYIPPTLRSILQDLLAPRFSTLDTHLSALAKLRSEAAALRSISDNISRKRAIEEDDDKVAEREEKKRKKEEDEKKKKLEGRGIKQLKKVDTSGMKKMSSFFQKMPKKA